jgi:hypothetical protein
MPTREVPDHLVRLPDQGWAVWRWSQLRGAGFPRPGWLTRSRGEECAAAAGHATAAGEASDRAQQPAAEAVRQLVRLARTSPVRNRLRKPLRALLHGEVDRVPAGELAAAARGTLPPDLLCPWDGALDPVIVRRRSRCQELVRMTSCWVARVIAT